MQETFYFIKDLNIYIYNLMYQNYQHLALEEITQVKYI